MKLIACIGLGLCFFAQPSMSQTKLTYLDDIIKNAVNLKPVAVVKMTNDTRLKYRLISSVMRAAEIEEERKKTGLEPESEPKYPRFSFTGQPKSLGIWEGSFPGIGEFHGIPYEKSPSYDEEDKKVAIWTWETPTEMKNSYFTITSDQYGDLMGRYNSHLKGAVLTPIDTSDSNPVLLMFDMRSGLKWSQRLPLRDCFEQLKMELSTMILKRESVEVYMSPKNGKIVANVKGGGRWKYNLSFIYDLDGNLLKTIVLPNDSGITIDDSGKRSFASAKVRKIASRKADGSVEEGTAYDYFLIDTDKDQAIRFDPGDNVYLTDIYRAYDQGHISGKISPDFKMTAIFETNFKD